MQLAELQNKCIFTAVYPENGTCSNTAINYCIVGMVGEAGEAANKWKEFLRDGIFDREGLARELQDTIWYALNGLAELNYTFDEAAEELLLRLQQRKKAGTLQGSGDKW